MYLLTTLAVLFLILFAFREFAAYRKNLSLKYFLTPAVTFSIILIVLFSVAVKGPSVYAMLVLIALIFALIADTLLMIEEIDLLNHGILFFMISHIFYVFAFSNQYSFQFWHPGLVLFILLVNVFHIKLIRKGTGRKLIQVVLYIVILDMMGFFAIAKLSNGSGLFEYSLALGAAMFWVSDLILSINAFVKKIPHSTVYTWLFYAPAQFLFALSTLH